MTAPDETRDLRALLEKSTPGVWKVWGMTVMADQDGTSNVDTAVEVAHTLFRDENGKPRTWDADLICQLHNQAAYLLDRSERLARLERSVAFVADTWAANAGDDRDAESKALRAVAAHLRALLADDGGAK